MIVAGLVAVLVFGVGLIVRGGIRLVRRAGVEAGDAPAGDVAILLVARDRADRIGDAVTEAGRLGATVFVVSDGSADRTAELAYERGAEVVETLRPLGPGRSVLAGTQSFRLAERYAFVLVLDVDVRLDPTYLAATLPLFGDAGVAAVDARVTGSGVLGSYLARTYALSQPFGRGRVGPPATVAHAAPGVARLYRTEVFKRLELDLPTSSVTDFDVTLQIYRDHLGRVALSPGPPAVWPPVTLARYREWRRAMLGGLGAAVSRRPPRRDRHGVALGAQLAELLGTALLGIVVPVAAVVGAGLAVAGMPVAVLNPLYLLAGFLTGDYLLTIAVTRRAPVVALAFPLLRVVDAVDVLRVAVRPRVLAWAALVTVGVAAVFRVAVATTTLPASAAERALADATYRIVAGQADAPLPAPLAVTGVHLDIYAVITSPFGRHLDVLTGARELSVLAAAVVVGGLVAIATVLRVHPLLTAVVLVAFAAPGPVVAVFGAVGPGVVAAGWLAVALAVGVNVTRQLDGGWQPDLDVSGVFGFVAFLVALATVPILVVPLAVGVAVWLWFLDLERHPDTTWRRPAVAVLFLTGCVVAVLWAMDLLLAPTGPVVDHRTSLLVALAAVAVTGLAVPRAWPAVAGTLTALGLAFGFGPDADALLPATVVGAAITGVLVLDAVLAWRPRAATGLAAAVAAAAAVAGVLVVPPAAPRVDHAALASWVTRELDDGVTIAAPTAVWADLHRDLVRLGRPNAVRDSDAGPLVVTTGPRNGTVLGRFGTLTLLATDIDRAYLDPTERAAAGRQLATNSRLVASEPVRAALRAGRVDLRVMAVLAALCAEHEITLVATGNPPAERGTGLPDRTVVIAAVDGRRSTQPLLDWLQAQRPPFAPASTRSTPDGLAVSWRLPDVFDRSAR